MTPLTTLRKRLTAVLATSLSIVVVACADSGSDGPAAPDTSPTLSRGAGPDVVSVTTRHLDFNLTRDQIGSGWTTFRYKNRSEHTHFFLIEKLPLFDKNGDGTSEQMTLDDWIEDLGKPFQNLMDDLIGRAHTYPGASFGAWAVEYVGGVGLTAPGETSEITLRLDPGLYVIECYVKTDDGTFHAVEGMVEEFAVAEKSNAAGPPPNPSLRLTLSTARGIELAGSVDRPGMHTVEVFFEDQAFYGNFVQHDVNLVRLDGATDLDRVASWLDWRVVGGDPWFPTFGGMTTPAPAVFLGGAQEGLPGSTAYFRVHLERGDYAWIAELPRSDLLSGGGADWIVPFSVPAN